MTRKRSLPMGRRVCTPDWPLYWHQFPEIRVRSRAHFRNVRSFDGVELDVCDLGSSASDWVVMLMPPMSSLLLMLPTLVRLSHHIPVLAWEPRGFTADVFAALDHSLDAYVQDAEIAIRSRGIENIHVLAWCAGVDIAAELAHRQNVRLLSAALIAPLWAKEHAEAAREAIVHDVVEQTIFAIGKSEDEESRALFARLQRLLRLYAASDPADVVLQRLVQLNLTSPERIRYRFNAMREFFRGRPPGLRRQRLKELAHSVATHVLSFRDDHSSGDVPASFMAVNGRMNIDFIAEGGHFAPFRRPGGVCSSLLRFYQAQALRGVSVGNGRQML